MGVSCCQTSSGIGRIGVVYQKPGPAGRGQNAHRAIYFSTATLHQAAFGHRIQSVHKRHGISEPWPAGQRWVGARDGEQVPQHKGRWALPAARPTTHTTTPAESPLAGTSQRNTRRDTLPLPLPSPRPPAGPAAGTARGRCRRCGPCRADPRWGAPSCRRPASRRRGWRGLESDRFGAGLCFVHQTKTSNAV